MSAKAQATEPDVMTFPVVDQVTREIHEPLTHDDYQSKSHELGALVRRINSEEIGLKAYSKVKRGEIETLEEERDDLIRELDRGIGRDVECDVRLDEARKLRLIVRRDTGETIAEESFRASDYPPPLFAGTEGEESTVPHSRTIREAFVSTLDGPGGEAVQGLHASGFLDPTDWEIEAAPNGFLPFPTSEMLRDEISTAESNLDEDEATLAQILDDSGLDESSVIAIAINSRTPEASRTDDEAGVWDKLLEVRDARATIDSAHATLMKTPAESVEHDDRSEQLDGREVIIDAESAKKITQRARELQAEVGPTSRALRTLPVNDRVGRWGVDEYWTAHDAGMLDPSEDDLRSARVAAIGAPDDVDRLNEDLDAIEQDCAAEIKTSAKARMAITRGTWPTKVAKVDDAIGAVRYGRARLEVALDNEAEASA